MAARALISLIVGLVALSAHAQEIIVNGFVTDAATGQPLELASVALLQGEAVALGTATGAGGAFVLPRLAPGRYVLRASFVGYELFADTLRLTASETYTVEVALRPATAALSELVVEQARPGGAADVVAGQQTVRPEDLARVPTFDVSGDLASYLTTLPGVVSTADRGGQLFIRGGEPSQNLVLLDGIPLYQPFHALGFYSVFPADILQRADVYAGGFPARFGERLSSVIDVQSREGHLFRYGGAVGVSPFLGSVRLEGPLVSDRASMLFSGRTSLVEPLASRYVRAPLPFRFGDAFAKLFAKTGRTGRLSFTGLHAYDRATLGEDTGSGPPEEIRWRTSAAGGRYVWLPRQLPTVVTLTLAASWLTSELGPTDAPIRRTSVRDVSAGLNVALFGEGIRADFGMAARTVSLANRLGGLYQNLYLTKRELAPFAFYLEPEFTLGAFRVTPSLRMQVIEARTSPVFEPRLRAVWERGRHRISAAAGVYHQETVGLSDRRDAASIFTVWASILGPPSDFPGASRDDVRQGRLPAARHAIAGYGVRLAPGLEIAIEGFYKQIGDLFVAEWTAFPRLSTRLQPAEGRSFGFDARLEWEQPRFYAAFLYGLSSTRYEAQQEELELWYGDATLAFRPPHDRRHQLNVLAQAEATRFKLSVRWAFGSGLPYSRVLGFDGFALIDDQRVVSKLPARRRVIYERPFRGLLPTYHRLDVALARTFWLRRARLTLQASAINAYDRRNIFYLDTFTLRRVDQLPFVPSVGLQVTFEQGDPR